MEHQAVKYTNLGPFSPGWKVTSKQSENETMPSKLDAYILVSHVENGATVPRWTSAQYQIDVQVIFVSLEPTHLPPFPLSFSSIELLELLVTEGGRKRKAD